MSEVKGLVIGKFAPPHTGHLWFINQVLEKCDSLMILLSFDKRWVEKQDKRIQIQLSVTNRFFPLAAVCERISKNVKKNIICDIIDESQIPEYPNGYHEFCKLCEMKFNEHKYYPDTMFSSEPNYVLEYKKYWPNINHVLIDPERINVNISATEIRKKMLEKIEIEEWLHKWSLV